VLTVSCFHFNIVHNRMEHIKIFYSSYVSSPHNICCIDIHYQYHYFHYICILPLPLEGKLDVQIFILNMFHLLCINQVHNIQIINKMHFNVYGVFYLQFSHQPVSATIVASFGVILSQEYKVIHVVSCVKSYYNFS
jgi:hypothetical protein